MKIYQNLSVITIFLKFFFEILNWVDNLIQDDGCQALKHYNLTNFYNFFDAVLQAFEKILGGISIKFLDKSVLLAYDERL